MKKEIKIIVDYREKNSLVVSELIDLGINIEFSNLKVGDYIANGTLIERKSFNDFVSSMLNKRILMQIENLKPFERKILIIEGISEDFDNKLNSKLNSNAIRGFLLSIILKHKVPVIFTRDYEETAKYLFLLAKKQKKEISLKVKRKARSKKEQLKFIVESFPGIGPKTSKKILKKFKTIRNFINSDEKSLREILGKKADIILKIINEKY
ncbi:MAG: multidrug MFS transporter [Candidatus Pacearchaeota archaeon]|nr:MAG: multidrug MFS transporter [Candidatus Pacearchaeota archaeon]